MIFSGYIFCAESVTITGFSVLTTGVSVSAEVNYEIHKATDCLHEMADYPSQPNQFSFFWLACSLGDFLPSFTAGVIYPKYSFELGLRAIGLPSMKCSEQKHMYVSNSFLFNALIHSLLMSSFFGNLCKADCLRQAQSLWNIPTCSSYSLWVHNI